MSYNLISRKELSEIIVDISRDSFHSNKYDLRFEFSLGTKRLFDDVFSSDEIIIKTADEDEKKEIVSCLERSGESDVEATFMPSAGDFTSCSTKRANWSSWLAEQIGNYNFVCVDTNILINHYCSNFLLRWLGNDQFRKIKFRIPRLSILEIERLANEEVTNEKDAKKWRKKRLGLSATAEVMFLKANQAELLALSSTNKLLVTTFLEKAGNKKVDAWIRQEIFDFASGQGFPQVLFLTCDLANGLAAVSEGFNTCVFSRIDQEKFIVETDTHDATPLSEFIFNVAVSFGKITMSVYQASELKYSYEIDGAWTGKTPYNWVHKQMRVKYVK